MRHIAPFFQDPEALCDIGCCRFVKMFSNIWPACIVALSFHLHLIQSQSLTKCFEVAEVLDAINSKFLVVNVNKNQFHSG